MRTPVKGKVAKIRSLFEKPTVSKFKSAMGKPSKKKMAAIEGEKAVGSKDNDSTSDQDEGFTTVKPHKMKKKFVLPRTGSQKDKDKEEDVMVVDNEAGPSGLNKTAAEKRPRDSDGEEEDTCYEDAEELESSFISDIKQMLEEGGAGHMFAPIRDRFQKFVAKMLKKQATQIKAEMVDIRRKERELDRCGRSIIIHNADRIAMEDDNDYIKYNLAEMVTETLHTMCRSMICVMEAYTLGKWNADTPPHLGVRGVGVSQAEGGHLQGHRRTHKGQDGHWQGAGGSGLQGLLPQGADSGLAEAGPAGQGPQEQRAGGTVQGGGQRARSHPGPGSQEEGQGRRANQVGSLQVADAGGRIQEGGGTGEGEGEGEGGESGGQRSGRSCRPDHQLY